MFYISIYSQIRNKLVQYITYFKRIYMNNIYRPNGNKVNVSSETKDKVTLLVGGSMYSDEYMKLDNTAKTVLDSILKYISNGTNIIHIGGDTLVSMCKFTGYQEQTIRKAIVRLNDSCILEKTTIRGEYIVNPLFAYKGDESRVWLSYSEVENEHRRKNEISPNSK